MLRNIPRRYRQVLARGFILTTASWHHIYLVRFPSKMNGDRTGASR